MSTSATQQAATASASAAPTAAAQQKQTLTREQQAEETAAEAAKTARRQVLGSGREAEDTGAVVKIPVNEAADLKGYDEQTKATMTDTAISAEKGHPAAANAGRDWQAASALAPKDGFYDERYRCATLTAQDLGDDDEIDELFSTGEPEPPKRITFAFKGINDEHCEVIATCLKKKECKCEALWLNDNLITVKGAKQLADALKVNTTLTELYLNYNNIGDDGLEALLDALKTNKTLLKLELGCCHIGEAESGAKNKAAEAVKTAIGSNKTIEHIGLFCNNPNIEDDLPDIYKTLAGRSAARQGQKK